MKRLELKPNGFPCKLSECPPGLFLFNGSLNFKSEYITNDRVECYCMSGEYFFGGVSEKQVNDLIVQPLEEQWIEL